MTNPNKILNFLDVTGQWDPTLLIVMIAAVVTTFLSYRLIEKLKKPIYDTQFHWPQKTKIDRNLIIGSAIFGIGWGIAGYCPGPSVTALATFNFDPVYFVVGMFAGSLIYYWIQSRYNSWRK